MHIRRHVYIYVHMHTFAHLSSMSARKLQRHKHYADYVFPSHCRKSSWAQLVHAIDNHFLCTTISIAIQEPIVFNQPNLLAYPCKQQARKSTCFATYASGRDTGAVSKQLGGPGHFMWVLDHGCVRILCNTWWFVLRNNLDYHRNSHMQTIALISTCLIFSYTHTDTHV